MDLLMELQAALPSGRSERISVSESGTIGDLRKEVQQSLGRPFLRLTAPDGRLLNDPTESLELAGLKDGDTIAVVAQRPKVAAMQGAFALWCEGGDRVVTWGDPGDGGDSSRVLKQLRNVQQIHSAGHAFAAILADRSVVTWGNTDCGGNSSGVHDQLRNVHQIYATNAAFAAVSAGGNVVTWGLTRSGGDSSSVQALSVLCGMNLPHIPQLSPGATTVTTTCLMAPCRNTSVNQYRSESVLCGNNSRVLRLNPGEAEPVVLCEAPNKEGPYGLFVTEDKAIVRCLAQYHRLCLSGIEAQDAAVVATQNAFAAILVHGRVATWGHQTSGGDSCSARAQLRNVREVHATQNAFAAILADGRVVTWGHQTSGGDSSRARAQLRNVREVHATYDACAAVLADGSVVTWGHPDHGSDSSGVHDQLRNVHQIYATDYVFAASLADGEVITWGHPGYGGDSRGVQNEFQKF
eukprot:Skav202832  [mRNA]  locus=scaffold746:19842:21236:+ [translate_table: standard]